MSRKGKKDPNLKKKLTLIETCYANKVVNVTILL